MSNWRLGWRFIKGIDILPHYAGRVAAPQALHGIRGIFSFLGKRISPFDPQEKGIFIASEQLEEVRRLPIALPARGVAALDVAIRFAAASIIRCCAAVGGSAALRMRHTPCGCRSAYLVEVRSNSRLLPVSTMRRAQQCRYFARSLPPSNRHSRLTIVRRGCKT